MLRLLTVLLAGVVMLVSWDLIENNGANVYQVTSAISRLRTDGPVRNASLPSKPPELHLDKAWKRISP
jgi:hypothetical protein